MRVRIIVEGATEEAFVKGPLSAALAYRGVYVTPTVLGVPGHRGGRVKFQRVRKDILATLKQDQAIFCTTFFDLYGVGSDFPVSEHFGSLPGTNQAEELEALLSIEVHKELGDHLGNRRFLPYFQVYEFEALLFSDPTTLADTLMKPRLAADFQGIRDSVPTPEDINDGPLTAPSKRILQHDPEYRKVFYGSAAVERIGIPAILRECPRFASWFDRLTQLGDLQR